MQSCCFLSADFSEQHKGCSLRLVGANGVRPFGFVEFDGTVKTVPYDS